MKEKKKIFWIIGLSLILLTICIIGIIVIKNIYMKDKYIDEDGKATTIDTPQGDVYEEAKYSKEKVANSTYFYSIEKCINNYLNAIKIGGAVDVIDLVDSNFIKTNNLNTNNILTNIESAYTFLATEIYETRDKTLYSYIVKGTEDDGKYDKEKYYIVNLDLSNYTYAIIPLYKNNYTDINQIEAHAPQQISSNNHNSFEFYRITSEEIAQKYVKYYINLITNNPTKAYQMLDSEYREKDFKIIIITLYIIELKC